MWWRLFIGFCLLFTPLVFLNTPIKSVQAGFIDGGATGSEPIGDPDPFQPVQDELNPGQDQQEAPPGGGGGTYYPPPPPPPAEDIPTDPTEPEPDYPPPPPAPGGEPDPGGEPAPFVPPDNPPPGEPDPPPGGPPNPTPISMGPLISYCLGDNRPVIKLNWRGGDNARYFKIFRSDMWPQVVNAAPDVRAFDEYGVSNCGPSGCTSSTVTRFDHNVENGVTYAYAIEALGYGPVSSWTPGYSNIQAADCTPPPPPPSPARFSRISTYCAADNLPVIRMEWTNGENARYYKLFQYDVTENAEKQVANISSAYRSFEDYTINNCGPSGCLQPGYASRFDHTVINNQYYNYIIASMPFTGAIGGVAWSSYTDAIQAPNCAPTPCQSAPNSCGQRYSGMRSIFGVCSVNAAPPNPSGYGQACNNLPNSCGDRNQGSITCNGSCSATGRVSERPNYGTTCQTLANNCGEVSTGSNTVCNPGGFQSGVSCSVSSPPLCAAPTITNGPSTSVCDSPGLVGWSGKSGLFGGKYGYSVDISLTSNFATKYSRWIDSPMGTTGGSTILPTDIDWKGFNEPGTLPGVHTWYVRVWNGAFSAAPTFQTQTCSPTLSYNILYGSNKTPASATVQFVEGNIATLEWTPTNATSCTASGNSSSWSGAKAYTGTNTEGIRDLNAAGSPYTLALTCIRGNSQVINRSFTINVYKAAFIKTTGGNVHSNENIVTPGQ